MRRNEGNNSNIYKNAKGQAEDLKMRFERLQPAVKHEGTLAHFITQVDGQKVVYHYGYHSIFQTFEAEKNRQLGIVIDDEEHDWEEDFEEEVFEFEPEEKLEHSYL